MNLAKILEMIFLQQMEDKLASFKQMM